MEIADIEEPLNPEQEEDGFVFKDLAKTAVEARRNDAGLAWVEFDSFEYKHFIS